MKAKENRGENRARDGGGKSQKEAKEERHDERI